MKRPSSPTSSWFSPPAGSSSSSSRGPEASARASSIRFRVPNGSPAAGRYASPERPTYSSSSAALRSPRRACAPTFTLSSTESVGQSATFWNVRATPRLTTRCTGVRSRSSPSKTTRPSSGLYRRVITLNAVVFPAPLGPISPTISPAGTSKDTSSSATTPPKRRVTFSTERSAATWAMVTRSRGTIATRQSGEAADRRRPAGRRRASRSRAATPAAPGEDHLERPLGVGSRRAAPVDPVHAGHEPGVASGERDAVLLAGAAARHRERRPLAAVRRLARPEREQPAREVAADLRVGGVVVQARELVRVGPEVVELPLARVVLDVDVAGRVDRGVRRRLEQDVTADEARAVGEQREQRDAVGRPPHLRVRRVDDRRREVDVDRPAA